MDKQLRAALKTAHPDEPVPQSLTDRILANWERLLCENYEFAAERNVETLLWKNLVYRTIDEYRRVLKQYEQLAAKTPAGKVQLKKLESQFLAFLQRMNGYYTALVDKLATEYDVEFLSDVLHGEGIGGRMSWRNGQHPCIMISCSAHTPTENPTPLQEKVIACCHRTIVYLGDLGRHLS